MSTPLYVGARVTRNEDPRLPRGHALFVDAVELPGLLHAAFLRSPYAHARLKRVDVSAALGRPGVVAAHAAANMGDYWRPARLLVSRPPVEGRVFNERTQAPLARDKVRFVGEPVVIVV